MAADRRARVPTGPAASPPIVVAFQPPTREEATRRIARIEGNNRVIPRRPATPRARTLVRGDASRARGRRGGEVDRPGDGADQQRRLCESRFPRARSVITPRARDGPTAAGRRRRPPRGGGGSLGGVRHAAYAAVGPPPGVAPPPGIAPAEGDAAVGDDGGGRRGVGSAPAALTPPPRSTRTGVPTARRTRTRRRDTPRPGGVAAAPSAEKLALASPRRSPRSSPPPRRPRPRLRLPRASPSAAPRLPRRPRLHPRRTATRRRLRRPRHPRWSRGRSLRPRLPPSPPSPRPRRPRRTTSPRRSSSGARAAPPRAHPPPPPPRPPHHPPSDPRRDRNGATPPPPPSQWRPLPRSAATPPR